MTRRLDGRDRPSSVGVDIGGSKIAVLVVDRDGASSPAQVAPTAAGAQERAADAIAAVVDAALADAGATDDDVAAIGVGVPGRVDPLTGTVTLAVNLGWHDLPSARALEQRFGRPCVVENDVRAAALGLHRRRVVGAIDDLAYLAVGTGRLGRRHPRRPAPSRRPRPGRRDRPRHRRAGRRRSARAASAAASRPSSRARPSPARGTRGAIAVEGRRESEPDAARPSERRQPTAIDVYRAAAERRPPGHRDRRRRRPPAWPGRSICW